MDTGVVTGRCTASMSSALRRAARPVLQRIPVCDLRLHLCHYLATVAARRVTLRFGCHNRPLTATAPATLPPFALLLLVLDTRFTAAARAQALRTRRREADDREDFITRSSIFAHPGPARCTSYAVTGGSMCHYFTTTSHLLVQLHMPPLRETTYFLLRTALNKPSRSSDLSTSNTTHRRPTCTTSTARQTLSD